MKPSARNPVSGLTLLEIIVALLIFALVLTGLGNVFVVARRYMVHSRARLSAIEAGKFLLAPLNNAVRQDTFDSGELAYTSPTRAGAAVGINGMTFNSTFAITDAPAIAAGSLRKVNLVINWNESSF